MKIIILTSILLGSCLYACQYHSKSMLDLPNVDFSSAMDREEYYKLLRHCKMIKDEQIIIADHRINIKDAIQTSITLYLQNIDTFAARVLLRDLEKNNFELK